MVTTRYQQEMYTHQSDPLPDALRSELETTRAAFHALLDSVARARWNQKGPTSAWTVGEIFVHLTWALENLPEEVTRARRGQGMFNLPKRLADPLSYWYIRWISRSATPDSIGRRYDAAMDASIRLIETISTEEWKHGANFYGEGFHTVQDLFHTPSHHLTEHTSAMRPTP